MKEFLIHDSIWDVHLTIAAESRAAANRALLRYLINRGFQICVLEHGFLTHHFIVVGEQNYFSAWLKKAYDEADRYHKPVVEHVASLEDDAVNAWIEDILPKEVWTYYISHEFDDEFNRSGPTLRSYSVALRHFTTVESEQKDDPAFAELREAGYLAANVKKEEAL